jgi:predicted DNA-binding antitoxin AbrB/MazE fold protein
MMEVITATFEDGVLKPDRQLGLSPGTKVRVVLEPLGNSEDARTALDELDQLCDEYPIDSEGTLLTRDQLHERR